MRPLLTLCGELRRDLRPRGLAQVDDVNAWLKLGIDAHLALADVLGLEHLMPFEETCPCLPVTAEVERLEARLLPEVVHHMQLE